MKRTTTGTRTTIAMLMSHTTDRLYDRVKYHHTTIGFVTVGRTEADWESREVGPDQIRHVDRWQSTNGLSLHNLTITDQSDSDGPTTSCCWEMKYEHVDVTARNAPGMASTLSRIDKRVDAIVTAEGYPADFAAHIMTIARAMGVTTFLERRSQRQQEGTGQEYRTMNGADAVYTLRSYQAEFAQLCEKADAA